MGKIAEAVMALGTALEEVPAVINKKFCPWEIGKVYLIRTVTMIDVGIVVAVTKHEVVLEEACWIADTGRFSDALKSCAFNETEPFPAGRVIIGRGAIIDAVQVPATVRVQK